MCNNQWKRHTFKMTSKAFFLSPFLFLLKCQRYKRSFFEWIKFPFPILCENRLKEVQGATTSSHIPHLSYKTLGHVYSSCMRSAMLVKLPLTSWTCSAMIGPQLDRSAVSSQLLAKLELEDLDLILRERRLCWFGHVECSSGAVRTACDIQTDGRRGTGRPKLTWKKLTEKDCHEWKLTTVDPQERST